MKTDWKTIYCIMVSLIAFILVSLTTSDMYQSREQSKYWKTRYNLLVGLLAANNIAAMPRTTHIDARSGVVIAAS